MNRINVTLIDTKTEKIADDFKVFATAEEIDGYVRSMEMKGYVVKIEYLY